jgi:DNA-binding transcriptional LysR family regulator
MARSGRSGSLAAGTTRARSVPKAKKQPLRAPRILTYVDAVSRHGSIRKAADALHVASSALNRQVIDLETALGSPLFERLPRGVRLTAAGELFIGYARHTISELKVVGSRIEQLRGLVRGRVCVAAPESVADQLLPWAIKVFQAGHPKVHFQVRIGPPQELVRDLLDDQADIILTHNAPRERDVAIVAKVEQALCAIVNSDHPLAGRSKLRLRDCLACPVALQDRTLAGRVLIDQVLDRASFELEPALISNSIAMMISFARVNAGVCFQFRTLGRTHPPLDGMVAIPLIDPPLLQAKLFMAVRRNRALPIAASAFAEQLRLSLS